VQHILNQHNCKRARHQARRSSRKGPPVRGAVRPASLGRGGDKCPGDLIGRSIEGSLLELPRRTDPGVFEDGDASRRTKWRRSSAKLKRLRLRQGPLSLRPRDNLSPLLPDVASHEMHRTPAAKLAERSDMTRHTVNLAWRTLPFFTIRLPI
jgi:hypothetical protein